MNPDNLPGSMQLMETNPETTFSEDLLNTAERYGVYLSALLEQSNTTQTNMINIMADNICENEMAKSLVAP